MHNTVENPAALENVYEESAAFYGTVYWFVCLKGLQAPLGALAEVDTLLFIYLFVLQYC